MTNLVLHSEAHIRALIRPEPRSPISIRLAISRGGHDLEFIDALQKKHSKQVGWMSSTWLETNIRQGNILIAQDEEEGSIGLCLDRLWRASQAQARRLRRVRCLQRRRDLGQQRVEVVSNREAIASQRSRGETLPLGAANLPA
jgi:hypothetical protein